MNIKDGKQIEKLLVGEVKNPIPERELIRNGLKNLIANEGGQMPNMKLEQMVSAISRLPDEDSNRKKVFSAAIRPIREKIRSNLLFSLEEVRKNQINDNESLAPSRLFASRLLDDLENALEDVIYASGEDGEKLYELRLYTAIGSNLDHAVNIDFWVELRSVKTGLPVAQAKIDIKTDPEDTVPSGFADSTYYFDREYNIDTLPGKINPKAFEDHEYLKLVRRISKLLRGQLDV